MGFTKKTKLILFALYWYYKETEEKFKDKPLKLAISKVYFIDMIKKFELAKKQPRAIYRNLEVLEKKKLILYKQKHLFLTQKGLDLIKKILVNIDPYLKVIEDIKEKKGKVPVKRAETVFKY